MSETTPSWRNLFRRVDPGSAQAASIRFLILKKHGEPLLVVPHGVPAETALSLYPAQSLRGRLAKIVWHQLLRTRLLARTKTYPLFLDPNDPFIQFLNSVSKAEPLSIPRFAVLAGNPHALGRRFLLLLFDPPGQPIGVVKAGVDAVGRELIEREAAFLSGAPPLTLGLPKLGAQFHHGSLRAFALDFVTGSPPAGDLDALARLLYAWLKLGRQSQVRDLAAWQRLRATSSGDPLFGRLAQQLEGREVHTALFHGDLAPWNIKVIPRDGSWTVLDWERGELHGPPAWDWFHYILQPAILVMRKSGQALVRAAEEMLNHPVFRSYARSAGLEGLEREWLMAYLLHCRDMLRPAEGSPRIPELLQLLQ
jgi:hypothetical protein